MLSEEQLLMRQKGIGASDIGILLGINDYKSPLDLYYEKTGEVAPVDLSDNEAVVWGNALEQPIAERYAQLYEVELEDPGTLSCEKNPIIMATPDRLIKGQKKGIEIKTVGVNGFKRWGTPLDKKIPESYFWQVQQCMYVLDYEAWDLVALFGGQRLEVYTFERDKEFDEIIERTCNTFWDNHVIPRIPPPVDYDYPDTRATLKKIYNEVLADQVDLGADVGHWVGVWEESKEQISVYNKSKKTAEAHLLNTLGNNGVGILPDGSHLVRKKTKRKGYTVEACEYVTLSHKKL